MTDCCHTCFRIMSLKRRRSHPIKELEVCALHHDPYFFEETMNEHRQELKAIESNAWKWTPRTRTKQVKQSKKLTVLSGLLTLIRLK